MVVPQARELAIAPLPRSVRHLACRGPGGAAHSRAPGPPGPPGLSGTQGDLLLIASGVVGPCCVFLAHNPTATDGFLEDLPP